MVKREHTASTALLEEWTLSEKIQSLNDHMGQLASAGEWEQILEELAKRNAMLLDLEDSERKAALMAARQSTEQILSIAESARQVVAKKLTDMSRGKRATDSYRAHT